MDAGGTLRAARRSAGLSQGALAAKAGTSQATISAYESGAKQPSVATFSRLLASAGSRMRLEPAHRPVIEPSPAQFARVARALGDVLELAEALPVRHDPAPRFPRLDDQVAERR